MIKIGLTGGIGSGKSVVANCLEVFGYDVYYADIEARRLTNEDPRIVEKVKAIFGSDIYKGGELDRKRVGEIVFAAPDKLKALSDIIHPVVRSDFDSWCKEQGRSEIIFQESAIVYENNNQGFFDFILLVVAPNDVRIKRVVNRDSISIQRVKERIDNQWSDSKKAERADYVIRNNDFDMIVPQLLSFIRQIN